MENMKENQLTKGEIRQQQSSIQEQNLSPTANKLPFFG
jgi:hypothetical protein